MSPSLNYLKFVIEIFTKTMYDTSNLNLEEAVKIYIRQTDESNQMNTLDIVYNMCHDCVNFTDQERYKLGKNILVYSLQASTLATVEEFYKKIFEELKITVNKEITSEDVVKKIIAFIIVENIFMDIESVSQSYLISETFRKNCIDQCLKAGSKSKAASNVNKELLRLYNCHTYNALASMICNSNKIKTDVHFQVLFLFNKGDIWKHVFDDRNFVLEYDTSALSAYKQIVTGIRDEIKSKRINVNATFNSQRYTQSLNLFQSTLIGSFYKYDFSNATLRNKFVTEASRNDNSSRSSIKLQVDDINKHECMAVIMSIITQITENDGEVVNTLPKWAEFIKEILVQDAHTNNAKIFFAKLIYNMKDTFKPYGKWFAAPIIKLITEGRLGNSITSLTADLVSWFLITVLGKSYRNLKEYFNSIIILHKEIN